MIADAAALGVLQVNFTGGEPLVRSDLETLVAEARRREPLRQPHHQRYPRRPGTPGEAGRRRAGQRPALDSGHRRARRGLDRRARRPAGQAGHRRSGARARATAHAERGSAPRKHRSGWGTLSRSPNGWGPSGSSSRTRSISGGRWPIARCCCLPRAALSARARDGAQPRATACGVGWRSCSCGPTTTGIARAPAWTAGRVATW